MAEPVTAPQSQTLDRGLRILEHLAATGSPRPVMEIATAVGCTAPSPTGCSARWRTAGSSSATTPAGSGSG